MQPDHEGLQRQREALVSCAKRAVSEMPEGQRVDLARVVDSFARLTPPQNPEVAFEYITVHSSGRRGGQSRKAGNVFLNWRKLMDIVPDVTVATVGALTTPAWVVPFVGLYVWNKLWRGAEEHLSDVEATTILALWKNRNSDDRISEEQGYAKTTELRSALSLPPLSPSEYAAAVNRLLAMECIEMTDGVIWLREWVKVTY